jgi:hypothetical protein
MEKSVDRFDLEQAILSCGCITDDIYLLEKADANVEDFAKLAKVYEYKFDVLWKIFEKMIETKQFVAPKTK